MNRILLLCVATYLLTGCGGAAPVDTAKALPGNWACGELLIGFNSDGSYDWRVPPGGPVHFPLGGDNKHVKVHADGGYSLLGQWRLNGNALELDSMGETDRYQLEFSSNDAMRMKADDLTQCSRK